MILMRQHFKSDFKAAADVVTRVTSKLSKLKREASGRKRKNIKNVSEEELAKLYLIGGDPKQVAMLPELPPSNNPGMKVLYATRRSDGQTVVVKTRNRRRSFRSSREERDWRAATEFQLNFPESKALCQYYDVYSTRDTYYVTMERVEGKDLFSITWGDAKVSHLVAREVVRQILDGLHALHSSGHIHRDVKLENIVVDMDTTGLLPTDSWNSSALARLTSWGSPNRRRDDDGDRETSPPTQAKVIDFDMVQDWDADSPRATDVLGTDGYIAPEAYAGLYSPASDIYSVGVVMYKLLTGESPIPRALFDDQTGENHVGSPAMRRIQERVLREHIDFLRRPLNRCPEAAELVADMLALRPDDRPSAEAALKHAWFDLPASALP